MMIIEFVLKVVCYGTGKFLLLGLSGYFKRHGIYFAEQKWNDLRFFRRDGDAIIFYDDIPTLIGMLFWVGRRSPPI